MIDALTKKPLTVINPAPTWPYLRVAVSQLTDIRRVLEINAISHEVSEHFISIDGGPEVAKIKLGRTPDVAAIQKILDEAS